jgi:hypothetical protein
MITNGELDKMRKEKAMNSFNTELLLELLHEGTEESNENIELADFGQRFKL